MTGRNQVNKIIYYTKTMKVMLRGDILCILRYVPKDY